MPYISTKTTVTISSEKKDRIKDKFGKAIELLPGKSEQWLMLSFEDNSSMYFQGNKEQPIAYVEVKLFGKASEDSYKKLTKVISEILQEELSINAKQIYIKYEEVSTWGWNGRNF